MLPSLKQQSMTNKTIEIQSSRMQLKKLATSKLSRNIEQAVQYEQKFQNQLTLNKKLKKLLTNLQSNIETNAAVIQQENQIMELVKQRRKLQNQVQHQAHSLNILISDNSKLKQQVDSQRNKRAIYFNIYKNLEHEIHQWETRYKNMLIESLKSEGAIIRVKEKFRKAIRKVEKDISALNNQLENLTKIDQGGKDKQRVSIREKQKSGEDITLQLKYKQKQRSPLTPHKPTPTYLSSRYIHNPHELVPTSTLSNTRKSSQNEQQYEIEQKSIQLSGIVNRLKHLCGKTDLIQCCTHIKNIKEQIEYNYSIFKQEQRRQKQLQDKYQSLQNQLRKIEDENVERKSTEVTNSQDREIGEFMEKIKELQEKLSEKIGVKVQELPNQMLLHHCLRIRDQKKQGKKNLEKYLEQTKKQKPQCALLLTPKQMHKKVIQGQTYMI